jgi:signal transduction histidine kinase
MLLRLSLALSMVALLVLAGLQFYWIGQITVAERQRLERDAAESAQRFAEDLTGEIRRLVDILEPRPGALLDPESVATRYSLWVGDAAYPGLLKSVYIARYPAEVLQLDPTTEIFMPAVWPARLSQMAEFVSSRGRADIELPPDVLLIRNAPRFQGNRGRGGRDFGPGGFPPQRPPGNAAPQNFDRQPDPEEEAWLLAELNHELLVSEVLPALIARRFPAAEGRNYRVAITARRRDSERQTLFTSGVPWTQKELETPDYELDLFAPLPRRGPGLGGPPNEVREGQRGGGERGGRGGDRGRGDLRTLGPGLVAQRWQLLIKHPAGSLDTAAADFRTRNLAVSFGVLIVLGIGALSIGISGSRAHRLGNLQMEFAAGISHELRTPLAVIQSAAHNLRSGVVRDREGIEEYAAMVQTEARRLGDMVDQVLTYTETQSGRKRYDLMPVDVTDIAENAMRNMATVLRESNATVENHLDPQLPPVLADAPALTRCLQNLISNAIKYGSADVSPIRIDGAFVPAEGAGRVEVSVTDHGPGVPEADVRHLFEAFHRGSNADTNTPGNGLGLHLVDRMMAAQNGSVTYSPVEGGGAKFTLTLPVASPS